MAKNVKNSSKVGKNGGHLRYQDGCHIYKMFVGTIEILDVINTGISTTIMILDGFTAEI